MLVYLLRCRTEATACWCAPRSSKTSVSSSAPFIGVLDLGASGGVARRRSPRSAGVAVVGAV